MQIVFNKEKTRVHFLHENIKEYKALYDFPGLIKEDTSFYLRADFHIVYNVVGRIKAVFKSVMIDRDVLDFLSQEFRLKALPDSFKFRTAPMGGQEIALRYIYTVGSGGLLMAPGMGKSKVVLDYIFLMGFKKSLLICPKPLLFVWEDEVATHRPELRLYAVGDLETTKITEEVEVDGVMKKKHRYVVDRETAWKKELVNIEAADIVVINYNKAVTFRDELRAIGFDFIHLDEFLIKDNSTERTKAITLLSKSIPYRCGGSGTLINNTPLDMFAPVRYLEPSLVGGNFYNFKDRYTITNKGQKTGPKFVVGFRNLQEARSILESCCIVMTKEEWLKLPEKSFHYRYVQVSDEQRRIYQDLSSNYIAKIEGDTFLEVDNALVMMSKLYQVSNGFVYITKEADDIDCILSQDETRPEPKKKRETHFLEDQPKLDTLSTLLDNEVRGEKAIIWFNMQAEYTLIKDLLERRGDSFLTIKGGEGKAGERVREFNRSPTIKYLVCQAKSVNYGITVLGMSPEKMESMNIEAIPDVNPLVCTEIFYSLNFSLEVFLQQQDRIHRMGQTRHCNYYMLVANTPVERRIKEALENKMSIRRDMLVDIAEKLRGDVDFS